VTANDTLEAAKMSKAQSTDKSKQFNEDMYTIQTYNTYEVEEGKDF
tara:strand:+ start:959 stop:1096 length:138 start_codon:yes stop_codon:yes gene_type:complete